MPYSYIDNTDKLHQTLINLETNSLLSIDTEFIRTSSYYPQFALLQLYDGKNIYIIDPLAITDLSCLWQRLKQQPWVSYSFGEDIELFNQQTTLSKQHSIWDAQLAIAFLGQGRAISYKQAISYYLGAYIDKTMSQTNWLQRPLTQKQLDYAINDVLFLPKMFTILKNTLKQRGLFDYFNQECQLQVASRCKTATADKAYFKVKNSWMLKSSQLVILRELASWRLQQAKQQNIALNWLVDDKSLIALAKQAPSNIEQLSFLIKKQEYYNYGKILFNLINRAKCICESYWPTKIIRPIDIPKYKEKLTNLKQQINLVSKAHGIPLEILAPNKLINQLLVWQATGADINHKPLLISNWRAKVLRKINY